MRMDSSTQGYHARQAYNASTQHKHKTQAHNTSTRRVAPISVSVACLRCVLEYVCIFAFCRTAIYKS